MRPASQALNKSFLQYNVRVSASSGSKYLSAGIVYVYAPSHSDISLY